MTADDVLAILGLLRAAGVEVWVGGGWGIDALVGRQTREHNDLDLGHRLEQEPALIAALAAAGYVETLDWRPTRFVLTGPGGLEVDLHPLVFAPDGSAHTPSFDPEKPFHYPPSAFVTGKIGPADVPCLSAEQQVYFHQGYEPEEEDLADMALLREEFGIATHF